MQEVSKIFPQLIFLIILSFLLIVQVRESHCFYSQQYKDHKQENLHHEMEPPLFYEEHWHEHSQNLTRVFLSKSDHVAIYFDPDVNRNVTWPFNFTAKVWTYMTKTYGNFGPDPYLHLVIHTGKYKGGHHGHSLHHRNIHDKRNLIDIGLLPKDSWMNLTRRSEEMDILLKELSYFVENSSKNRTGSPSIDVWGTTDTCSKETPFADIFTFDVYTSLNFTAEAKHFKDKSIDKVYKYPPTPLGTHWFRDWFLPIYEQDSEVSVNVKVKVNVKVNVLNEYFQLLHDHLNHNDEFYTHFLTMGGFIHFWSGAAKRDLKNFAIKAFGWNHAYEIQFQKARKEFPEIAQLYQCNSCEAETLTYEGSQWDEDEISIEEEIDNKPSRLVCDTQTISTATKVAILLSLGFNTILISILITFFIWHRMRVKRLQQEICGLTNQMMKDYFAADAVNLHTQINPSDTQTLIA